MELTDDMRALLRAAYAVGPNGETFILENLALPGMDKTARHDCARVLMREPDKLLEQRYYVEEPTPQNLGGHVYKAGQEGQMPLALSQLGRARARQLVADEKRDRRRKVNAVLVWVALGLLTGAMGLMWNHLDRRLERWEEQQATRPS